MTACIQRIERPILRLLLPVILAGAAACSGQGKQERVELNEQETRLVQETARLIRVRLEMTRDPAVAAALRDSLGDLYTDQERQFLISGLAEDSARGEAVMDALHDSLEAMRAELFPPSSP
ncbi:hypothetical protein DRQ53_07635 [bacterium]|nr:MAG: hypothetical protein DRQ53_07635 [bacterium]